ncbi:MAG: hypothetical protein WCJ68_08730 [Chitinophagia bacterium]
MKNTLLLLFVFYSFLCNAQRTFFQVNKYYVGPVGASISATNGLSYLTSTTGQSGGTIASDGGNIITAKGVVWSTSAGPTVALSTKTNDGTGVGAFTSTLTGLTLNTVYYIRSYATNSVGTSYGPEVSFAFIPTATSATGKIWMDRNLGATQASTLSNESASFGNLYQWGRATDGHQLINSTTTQTPSASTTSANSYFVVGSNQRDWLSTSNNNLWQGVNGVNNPCPKGFRIPTKQEWIDEKATWNPQNASGALASPLKLPDTQKFRNFTDGGQLSATYYWSSTVENVTSTYYDKKSYVLQLSSLLIPSYERSYGFSCRCIQNY